METIPAQHNISKTISYGTGSDTKTISYGGTGSETIKATIGGGCVGGYKMAHQGGVVTNNMNSVGGGVGVGGGVSGGGMLPVMLGGDNYNINVPVTVTVVDPLRTEHMLTFQAS